MYDRNWLAAPLSSASTSGRLQKGSYQRPASEEEQIAY